MKTTVEIKKIGINGEGIGYINRKIVFIKGALLNEEVEIDAKQYNNKNYYFGDNGIVIDDVLKAIDDNKQLIGHVIKVTTKDGYGGDITLVVGIDSEDKITGIEVLSIDETVGLGMNARNESFKSQYYNKSVKNFIITKTGKQNEQEIDALSGATITSSAFNNAINGALMINQEIKEVVYE